MRDKPHTYSREPHEICEGRTPEDFGKVICLIELRTRAALCKAIDDLKLSEEDSASLAYFGIIALIGTYLQSASSVAARVQFMNDIASLAGQIANEEAQAV